MNESGKTHDDDGKAHKTFGLRPANEAEGHKPAAKEQHNPDQQTDHPQGAEQHTGEPGAHWSAQISGGFARRRDLGRVGRVVSEESKGAKKTRVKYHTS